MGRTVKERAPDQRPRERLLRFGAEALSDEELLAILLGSGTKGASALTIAEELLADGLVALARQGTEELMGVRGLGAAKAATLRAAFELGRRLYREESFAGADRRLATPEDAFRALRPLFPFDREEIWVAFLDARLRLQGARRLASGGIDFATLAPAEVLRAILRSGFTRFLVAHNHPTGDPTPSEADRAWTRRLAEGSAALGFEMVDHLIIGQKSFVSLRRLMGGGAG